MCVYIYIWKVLNKKNEKKQTVEATQRDVKLILFELRDLKVFF